MDRLRRWGSKAFLRVSIAFLVLGWLIATPVATYAHPLGNFTVNRYSRLELDATNIRVRYVVDMAEIPTFQEMPRIDTSGDGKVDAQEQQRYLATTVETVRGNLRLLVGNTILPLETTDEQLTFPQGQGGLQTMRLSAWFSAALPSAASRWQTSYQDNNFSGRIGWQEVVVQPAGPVKLIDSTAPTSDRSHELTTYPSDMLESPLAVNSATFEFVPGASVTTAPIAQPLAATSAASDRFAELISSRIDTPLAMVWALLVAFVLGAGHALAPGHGKTVVAAYLVGSRGTARHAMFLGLTTTITHTAGVFALGLVTLFISHYILPEQLYPWLGVISGLLVVVIGYSLARTRLLSLIGRAQEHDHSHAHHHPHDHTHDGEYLLEHDHGDGHVHSHLPPGANGGPVTWRNLLALGVSGGLLPCPSALVVLLSAIALQRVGLGMILIVAFSLGLASVLTAVGMLLVYAGRWFTRLPLGGKLPRFLPVLSAVVVTIVGLGITWQALIQTGLLGR